MDKSADTSYLLSHLADTLAKQHDQMLNERLGIGTSQFKILQVLEQNTAVQQKQIAKSLGQTEASISRQLGIMIDRGLLEVRVNPHNRRQHLTTLTAKGLRLYEEANKVLGSTSDKLFADLGKRDHAQLQAMLAMLHQTTCQPGRPGACNHLGDQ